MRRLTWVSVQMMRIRASIKQSVHHLRLGFAPTNNVFQSFQSQLHGATSQKSLVYCASLSLQQDYTNTTLRQSVRFLVSELSSPHLPWNKVGIAY